MSEVKNIVEPARVRKPAKKPPEWEVVESPSLERAQGRRVKAFTKGEARAALRRSLRVQRLPAGIKMAKVTPTPDS